MFQSIITEIDDSIGIISLNKPDRHNTLDELLIEELITALLELESNPQVRVVVLSSTGKHFCSGSDLSWMKRAAARSMQENLQDARNLAHMLATLNELSKPTIARVQGPAYGAGVGLIAACDIAVAAFDAHFALSEIKLGVLPALVSPYVLSAIGERQTRRYMLSAERFSAAEAYRIGLVHEVVPGDDQLDDAIGEIITSLLKNGPNAQSECKALIRVVSGHPIDEMLIEDTAQRATRVRSTPEAREGFLAYMEKRKPNWVR